MPVLFVGHGNPMNAIETNEFTETWKILGSELPLPQAILCISAHWETRGTHLTAMPQPKTIHDFGGFPAELYQVEYPAKGNEVLAKEAQEKVHTVPVGLDYREWGLDHGCWTVVRKMYPEADIPVVQMSIDHFQKPETHYQIARELAFLRQKGVLIIGSGNIVHNLREVDWYNPEAETDWAVEAREKVNESILQHNHDKLIDFRNQGIAFNKAIPTSEHFIPLLYTLALQSDKDKVTLFNDKIVMGSLSMTGVLITET